MFNFYSSLVDIIIYFVAALLLIGSYVRLGKVYRKVKVIEKELAEHRSAMKRFNSGVELELAAIRRKAQENERELSRRIEGKEDK